MSQLLVSQAYLKDKTVIQDNTDFKVITPVIVWIQELKLRPLLGTNLYNLIITQSTPPTTLSAANLTLLNDYILSFMLLYIQSECVMTFKYKYTNIGIVSRDAAGQGATNISEKEAQQLMDFYKNKAEDYGQLMVDYIKANPTLYPTYYTNTGLGNVIPQGDAFDTGIYLPERGKVITTKQIRDIGSGLNGDGLDY